MCVLLNVLYPYKYNSVHACVAGVRADPSCEVGWGGCWVLPKVLVLVYKELKHYYGVGWDGVGCCQDSTSTCI